MDLCLLKLLVVKRRFTEEVFREPILSDRLVNKKSNWHIPFGLRPDMKNLCCFNVRLKISVLFSPFRSHANICNEVHYPPDSNQPVNEVLSFTFTVPFFLYCFSRAFDTWDLFTIEHLARDRCVGNISVHWVIQCSHLELQREKKSGQGTMRSGELPVG